MDRATRHCLAATLLLAAGWSIDARAAETGTAVLRVETHPAANGAVRFSGTPAGQVDLSHDGSATLRANVDAGQHLATLEWIDPALQNAGYRLAGITCDDRSSQRRSDGDVGTRTATFNLEAAEAVTCTFQLSPGTACTCPKEGRWNVVNHTGSMACTGAMSMTLPLAASRGQGTLVPDASCNTVAASGMSDDEADIEMRVAPDCSYVGTVGGSRDGIPMTIKFTWNVENTERITGDLESNVSSNGVVCRMSRTYELDFMQ